MLIDGIAREREMLRDLRADADIVLDTTDLNVHELAAKVVAGLRAGDSPGLHATVMSFGYKYGLPVDADLVRRLPLPAQPALGARAAAADRPGPGGPRLRPGPAGARPSSSTPTSRSSTWSARATCARASATRRSPSAAPAASTARSPWPRSSAARLAAGGVDATVVHRDLGRE